MGKVIVFPGQGSQFVGMGKELYEKSEVAREVFDIADKALGFPISKICFEGPADELILTQYTQPAILTVSYALWSEFTKKIDHDEIIYMAGHSLGEYTAHVVTGSLKFEEAVTLVHKRGKYMQEAVEPGKGAMAATRKVPADELIKLCDECEHIVAPANFNSPDQIVISGLNEGVDWVIAKLKEEKKKAIKLKVSAPFHSELMKSAADKIKMDLLMTSVNPYEIPVISNVTAEPIITRDMIRGLLESQICSPVRWTESMLFASEHGVDELIEVGPGKVLSKLMSQIDPEIETTNIATLEDIEKYEND